MMNRRSLASAIVAACAILLLSTTAQAQAGGLRAELLSGRDDARWIGQDRHAHRHPGHTARQCPDRHRGYRREHSRGHQHNAAAQRARRYAAKAVDQAHQARRLGVYPDHPRWSLNFERHFRWALHADRWETEREMRRRARQLREWRHSEYGRQGGHGYRYKPYRQH